MGALARIQLAGDETGKMVEGIMAAVDVRDMTCAQALAVIAKAVAGLANGEALRVRYNADDVKRDLLVWAREGGHCSQEEPPDILKLQQKQSA